MTLTLIIIGLMSLTGLLISLGAYIIFEDHKGDVVCKTLKKSKILNNISRTDIVRFDFYKSAEFGV